MSKAPTCAKASAYAKATADRSAGGQAAVEYAIAFVVFTIVAVFLWTVFIKSNRHGELTVVEEYVGRVEGEIK